MRFHATVPGLLLTAFAVAGQAAEISGKALHFDASRPTGFTLLAPASTGVEFTNILSSEAAAENQIRLNGSGVALGDVNGDGLADIYLCRLGDANALYLNQGNWKFEERAMKAGVACSNHFSTGATFADLDGDSDLDLLVNGLGTGTRFFLNDGAGNFSEQLNSGLHRKGGSMSLALADVDGDSDLDLYVTNYRTNTIRTSGFSLLTVGGKRMLRPEDREDYELTPDGRLLEHGQVDYFYLNEGNGKFRELSFASGNFLDASGQPLKKAPRDWGLTAMFRDINMDGLPDLYVCNDFHSPDRIWLNSGKGKFMEASPLAIRSSSTFSMGIDFSDVDRDGDDDYLVLDMLDRKHERRMRQLLGEKSEQLPGVFGERQQLDRNVLQLARGDGTFAEAAWRAGVEATGWSWSPLFIDVDLDDYEDLLITTGNMFDTQDQDAEQRIAASGPWSKERMPQKLLMYPPLMLENLAFKNRGDGTFTNYSAEWRFDLPGVSHGIAAADLDLDGDLDLVVNNLNQAASLYRNDCPAPRLSIRLKGSGQNSQAIGARVIVRGGMEQSQEIIAGGRYLSGGDTLRVFAAKKETMDVEVRWPGGTRTLHTNLVQNHAYIIEYDPEKKVAPASTTRPPPLFQNVSEQLSHRHEENLFDDFARQPLLPRKVSQGGPGLAWGDFDGDGREDLIVGGSRGGSMAFLKNGRENFQRVSNQFSIKLARDQTSLLLLEGTPTQLVAGSSNHEDGLPIDPPVRALDLQSGEGAAIAPAMSSSVGPVAMADIDGDGDLDLFVGGRAIPGKYPMAASSLLLKNEGGRYLPDVRQTVLTNIGMVTAAIFIDLNQDHAPDLLLSREWGTIKVLLNKGTFQDASAQYETEAFSGFWNSIAAGDFNNDGQMDFVAGNWGLNTGYRASAARPFTVYYGDFDSSGSLDLIETMIEEGREVPVRDFNNLSAAIPALRGRFPTYAAFGSADIKTILGGFQKPATLSVNCLQSAVFMNEGNRFKMQPLPPEAQLSPVFGLAVADFDGDRNEDIFVAQNFFGVSPQITRHDSGRGLLLRGNGTGEFEPMSSSGSGIAIDGDQRAAAVCDYNQDGRVDLAVSQNGSDTQLFQNRGGAPGLRVQLIGTRENRNAIGAQLRVRSSTRSGPAREIQAGSGYWSCNSPVQVVARPAATEELEISWPGGRQTRVPLRDEGKLLIVKQDGTVDWK
ncbi:MAG: VCBS repeat-containing protein [Verrucomicrobiota bacterium]|nr:VCBS repeat-containing protein [Verrucomicrobiota bacterium]